MAKDSENVKKTYTDPTTGKFIAGNPGGGRPPKELSMTNAMREILNEIDPETKVERYKKLLCVAITKAEQGDNDMIKYLMNRIDGLPRGSEQTTNVNVVIPILGGQSVQRNNSDHEVIEAEE